MSGQDFAAVMYLGAMAPHATAHTQPNMLAAVTAKTRRLSPGDGPYGPRKWRGQSKTHQTASTPATAATTTSRTRSGPCTGEWSDPSPGGRFSSHE